MSEDDPFEELPDDREGDPFADLDGPPSEASDEAEADSPDTDSDGADQASASEQTFEEEFIEEGAFGEETPPALSEGSDASTPEAETDAGDTVADTPDPEEDPFAGMDGGDGDPFGSGESAFESVDIDTLDEEELWATLDEDGEPSGAELQRYAEVSKHRYCEQCEFFAEPPDSHCNHEEASIQEHLDMETVRLVDCPIVAEQRRIENEE